ncbi:MAG TPA: SH3-like domain-containing protein [Candidatus Elarobacter sp.]|nr:SH3-like domain-containing protein [Candidatus Elarobacter sp.]
MNPRGHTRLPRYLTGRRGRVDAVLGALPYPDRRAAGAREARETAYTVRFAAYDVWGPDGDAGDSICADLFESYLEPDG